MHLIYSLKGFELSFNIRLKYTTVIRYVEHFKLIVHISKSKKDLIMNVKTYCPT